MEMFSTVSSGMCRFPSMTTIQVALSVPDP